MKFKTKIKTEVVSEIFLYVATVFAIILLYESNIFLTAVLLLLWFIGLRIWPKNSLYYLLAGAIIGPVGEIICIYFGVWQYANSSFMGIPLWLPFGWGLAFMIIKRVTDLTIKLKK